MILGDILYDRNTGKKAIAKRVEGFNVIVEGLDQRGFWRKLRDRVLRGVRWNDKSFECSLDDCLIIGHAKEF